MKKPKLNTRPLVVGIRDLLIVSALLALAGGWEYMEFREGVALGLSAKESLDAVISTVSFGVTLHFTIGFFKTARRRVLSRLPLMNQSTPNLGP